MRRTPSKKSIYFGTIDIDKNNWNTTENPIQGIMINLMRKRRVKVIGTRFAQDIGTWRMTRS
jgi:hypothetical protein